MALPLDEVVRTTDCPACGAIAGSCCVRLFPDPRAGEPRAQIHQQRIQTAGRHKRVRDLLAKERKERAA